jgi:hypothetical protein
MNLRYQKSYYAGFFIAAGLSIVLGCASALFVPLTYWVLIANGLTVVLSLLAAAVLVRLSRNAPITTPEAFDEDGLKAFFDVLELLSIRLFWIFIQILTAIGLLVAARLMAVSPAPNLPQEYPSLANGISGVLAALMTWVLWRVIALAYGDIGLVNLQRIILSNALRRNRQKAAAKLFEGEAISLVSDDQSSSDDDWKPGRQADEEPREVKPEK